MNDFDTCRRILNRFDFNTWGEIVLATNGILDVASLHFNMGVVYDDLEQYDQAISRYHESLRIRLEQMNKATSPATISELEDSVLLT